jgi:hypothetical protein
MNIFKRLSMLWTNFDVMPQHRDRIKLAFKHDGIEYFMFDDIMKIPTCRGLHALDLYDEFSMRCTKQFLVEHCTAIEKILNPGSGKLDLIGLATLTKNLRDRLTLLPIPDHIFRLAAVVFFDKSENPYVLDRKYCDEKVKRWKRDPRSLSFFLSTPLSDLIPFLELQNVNLHTYIATVENVNRVHLDKVLSTSSRKDTKVDM